MFCRRKAEERLLLKGEVTSMCSDLQQVVDMCYSFASHVSSTYLQTDPLIVRKYLSIIPLHRMNQTLAH